MKRIPVSAAPSRNSGPAGCFASGREQAHKATAKEDVAKLRWLDRFLGGKDLTHITRATLDRIIDAKLALGHRNATVNRTLELVRAILRKCVNDWEWLDRAPKVRMLKEPTRRIRFLTQEDAHRLLQALPEQPRNRVSTCRKNPVSRKIYRSSGQ